MPIAQALLSEFEIQAPITRKFLERLPEDKLTWKPHEKSRSAGSVSVSSCVDTRSSGTVRTK